MIGKPTARRFTAAVMIVIALVAGGPIARAIEPVEIAVDLNELVGRVRALNGVQSGPLPPNHDDPIVTEAFRAAGVRLVRLPQDLGFGGEGDGPRLTLGDIFPDAAADPDDPAAYRFGHIDQFIDAVFAAGAEPLWQAQYDIGADANAWTPDGHQAGRAPRDPERWARVVVNVLRHLNDGWAEGHHWTVRFVEFPNDPCGLGGYDCRTPEDGDDGRPGRRRLFADFGRLIDAVDDYNRRFGHQVQVAGIGLPAEQAIRALPETAKALRQARTSRAIFSYHDYAWPDAIGRHARELRQALDHAGLQPTPLWNTAWNWPLDAPSSADLRGQLDLAQQSAYVAAHNVQVKTLVQDAWDEAIVSHAIRSVPSPARRDPDEGPYFILDHNRLGLERGTPKPAYHAWVMMDAIARETPDRVAARSAAATPTVLAARSDDGRRLSLLLAHFCPSRAAGCAEQQPYHIAIHGPEAGQSFRVTRQTLDGSSLEPSEERVSAPAGDPALLLTGSIALWSVQRLTLELDER